MMLHPFQIRFTQNSIGHHFQDGNSCNNLIKDILEDKVDPDTITSIKVVKRDGKYYSLDNRRLYVFRAVNYAREDFEIEVDILEENIDYSSQYTTQNDGQDIHIRGGPEYPHYKAQWFLPATTQLGDFL